tara:strand:+ start:284 stop:1900 length:1617 start_codon:yes stop_codon:yes gene_type:complete
MAYNQDENANLNNQLEEQNPYNINPGDLESLLDVIADALIKSPLVNTNTVKNNQKFIRDGNVKTGQGSGILALYQKDVEANVEDDLQSVANQINGLFQVDISPGINDTVSISISGGGIENGILDITNLVIGEGNPLNVSQFIPIQKQQSNVDIDKAEEFLDTNIFELLPESDSRQARIVRFFQELNTLLPPTIPNFGTPVNRDEDDNWSGAEQYSQDNSISYAQNNPNETNISEGEAFLHRLTDTANDTNENLTIQEIYDTIEPYLKDILEDPIEPQDDREEYENQSNGYLQFRNPNQGIIIRNTNQDFIEGLDPSNPTYLDTGFTITMWVRFLDKVSSGTLFNFGNPTRAENPFGFKLETYVLNKNDSYASLSTQTTWGEVVEEGTFQVGPGYDDAIFKDSDVSRFVRLQVRESGDTTSTGDDFGLRDSHVGLGGDLTLNGTVITPGGRKSYNIGDFNDLGNDELRLLQSTYIPEDFNEWYFICATYNPNVDEDGSNFNTETNPNYWLNRTEPLLGNRCKVEIISRSDLLRARGFKV